MIKIILEIIGKIFSSKVTVERVSPGDWIPQEVVRGWVKGLGWEFLGLVYAPEVWVPMIPDTNSMDGTFDLGNNNILISGETESDQQKLIDRLQVGDIAVYRNARQYSVHRIIEIGNDTGGKYFIFKGDNNHSPDIDRVREEEIKWISVGVIY